MILNRHQHQIVKTKEKYVEVRAAPGSGKTETLIKRINYLVQKGTPASKILVLSFSNFSVDELSARFHRSIKKKENSNKVKSRSAEFINNNYLPVIKTVHAFARSVVAESGGVADIATPAESLDLLKRVLQSCCQDAAIKMEWCKLTLEKRSSLLDSVHVLLKDSHRLQQLLAAINFAQASGHELRDVMESPQFAANLKAFSPISLSVKNRYTCAKNECGKFNFGDLLTQAIAELNRRENIHFTHVLVDEFQDGSAEQNILLATLVQRGCELMVFGDPLQAIYGFAGYNFSPLENFVDAAVVLTLPESHRLHRQTAALAMAVAGERAENIVTMRRGIMPVLVTSTNPSDQARTIARDIQELITDGVDPASIVVLARTREILKAVEQSLLAAEICTCRKGYRRDIRHVQRVLRLVCLVENYSLSAKNIEPCALERVFRKLKLAAQPDWQALSSRLKIVAKSTSLEGIYRGCQDIYLKILGGVRANTDIQKDINHWRAKCRAYVDGDQMLRATKQPKPVVQTMTIHAAKGGEWDHVFVVGVAEGQLPFVMSSSENAINEERRLLYVAITRACKAVRMYYAPTVHARSRKKLGLLSSFLKPTSVQRCLVNAGIVGRSCINPV